MVQCIRSPCLPTELTGVGGHAADKCEVVGVVGDVKFGGLDSQPEPELYVNYPKLPEAFMQPVGSMAVVVRGDGELRISAFTRRA
jgi:hypothetical protein